MAVIDTGAAMILPAPSFDALATMQAIQAERARSVYGVPTMFIAQLQHPEFRDFDFSSLRTGVMAGAPCPDRSDEARGRRHALPADDHHVRADRIVAGDHDGGVSTHRSNTACRPSAARVPKPKSRSWRPTASTPPLGEQGELCTRGYLVMKGYDQEPEATARAIDNDGWLHTGDLATMRPDGYFRITGRLKDMIIRGGENIYPREVEEFLYTHPKIADVQVVGLPDEKLGETVACWIKLKAGETADRRRDPRLLPRPNRALQDSAVPPLRRRVPDDGHREDSEVPDTAIGDRAARPGARGEHSNGVGHRRANPGSDSCGCRGIANSVPG